jgi:predicted ATPase
MHGVVGREPELAKIDAFLAGLVDEPAGLVIEGEVGIGKTTLWEEAVQRAGERRFAVLASRPGQSEARLSFTALTDLLASVPDAAVESLPSPQRPALGVALLREDPTDGSLDRRAVATALGSVLAMRAQSGPVLVAVDDAHWLDRASAEALEFTFARLARHPVGLLMALRRGEPEPFALARARAPGLVRIEIARLAASGLATVRCRQAVHQPPHR